MKCLQDRAALVTGAARGIGLKIARRLVAAGARVTLADVDGPAVREAGATIGPDAALAVEMDVADGASVERAVRATHERWGRLDILVNNAGIAGPAMPLWHYPEPDWRRVVDVDLTGVFLTCRAAVPRMLERGWGRIVNIASISGKEGNPNMAAYSAAKAGVIGLTKALAKELATSGILVNCVTPAVIETDILDQLTPEAVEYMVGKIPMGRTGRPDEVAALVLWLCSDACSFSTGAVFDVSGGRATY